MGDGGRRTEQGLGDTRRLLVRQHLVKGAMQRGDLRAPVDMVKPGDGFRRTLCDGGGVDMAVKTRIAFPTAVLLQAFQNFREILPHPGGGSDIQLLPAGVDIVHLRPEGDAVQTGAASR